MHQLRIFVKKYNKGADRHRISNRYDGFAEDIELENAESEQETVKRLIEIYWEKQN